MNLDNTTQSKPYIGGTGWVRKGYSSRFSGDIKVFRDIYYSGTYSSSLNAKTLELRNANRLYSTYST